MKDVVYPNTGGHKEKKKNQYERKRMFQGGCGRTICKQQCISSPEKRKLRLQQDSRDT